MTAPRKHWYLIAYDVREPKRLRKVHYYLSKQAVAIQKSVFAIETDSAKLADIQAELRARTKPHEDDLRLYAIPGPAAVWAAGQQTHRLVGMHGGHAEAGEAVGTRARRWFVGLFGREAA